MAPKRKYQKKNKEPKKQVVVQSASSASGIPALTEESAARKRMLIRGLMNQLNDNKEGKKIIAFASDVPNLYALRRPSGHMQLDIDTGGGLPAGGICYIGGPDNVGKTYLMYLYMAMHQRLYGDNSCIGIACAEGAPDYVQAIKAGMKITIPDEIIEQWNRVRLERGIPRYSEEEIAYFREQTGQVFIIRGNTGEEIMDAILDCVRTGAFGIIGLDSVSALLPAADADKDMDDEQKRAANAGLVTKFLLHYSPLTTGINGLIETTLIFISQVRANQERANAPSHIQKYIKPHVATGAWAGKHWKLIDLMLDDGDRIWKEINGQKCIVGKVVKWELEKGKAGTHDNIRGETEFTYAEYGGRGFDLTDSIVRAGMRLGILVERNSKIHLLRPETGEVSDIKDVPNMKSFKKMIDADFEFELTVRRELLAAAKLQCLYR